MDLLEEVDDDVATVSREPVVVLLRNVENKLEALGVLALSDPADFLDLDPALDSCMREGVLPFFLRL